ncbi:hypothetical protein [Mycoplasmopsis agalactiae]|nr:hypothetical protein [Mycoplasmopsis agalactiae]
MTSITANMHHKYDEISKELNTLSKDEFKKMLKEKTTIEAKKTFIFFILSISLLSIALLLLIPLILFNKLDPWAVKNAAEVSKVAPVSDTVKNISWALFALIIIFMLAGSYILSLYFSNKFKTKQQAYKKVDFAPVISKIFTYANLEFSKPEETNSEVYKTALEMYSKEDKVESATVVKTFTAHDIDNKNEWTINEVEILRNSNVKDNVLLLECAVSPEFINKSQHSSFYALKQLNNKEELIKNIDSEFVELDSEIGLYATNKSLSNALIDDLKKFASEFRLEQNGFGLLYNEKSAKLSIWFKSQNELFSILKSVDVASTLLNHVWLLTEIMNKTSILI